MIDEHLRDHDGVITLAQARMAGLSADSVERRVRNGHWRRCAPGVYFVDDRPFSDAARIRAAVWSHGSSATASGLAAAWWHGITRYPPDIVEVTVPKISNHRKREGIRVRRRDLKPRDVIEHRGLRVTGLPLTVVEAAARRGGGAKLLDTALQRHTELSPLWTAHMRNKGRHGSPRARMLLNAASDGARSRAERVLIKLLLDNGITGWKANHPVAGYHGDIVFVDEKIVIEIDGYAFHSDAEDFHNDRKRQNAIALSGYQVLRFSWLDLIEYPGRVLAEILRALRFVHDNPR